ncbi:MAG: NPCBM/NEW2 domain-containing protein [Phycisphaerae bacterium]|jgi:hypothetical protein|nr:NPCBM/NEW2 domain-containing protein [Phycisphaerae bacterium]
MRSSGSARLLSIWAAAGLTISIAHAEGVGRYEAVFVDGSRVVGKTLSGWGRRPGTPKLDKIALFDSKRPLRWLRDRELKAWSPSRDDAYIEFVGGDRIVGRIEGAGSGGGTDGVRVPEHLLVIPARPARKSALSLPTRIRIGTDRIRRVVFRHDSRRRLQPGVLCRLNGRRVKFVSLRWKDQSVVLLLKDGTRRIDMSEIAEVRLPRVDPWKAYYQELAVLSPACESRMMRIETIGGLAATGGSLRFGATAYHTEAHRHTAEMRMNSLKGRIAQVESSGKKIQQGLQQARRRHEQQAIESRKQEQAARKAYDKNVAAEEKKFQQQIRDIQRKLSKTQKQLETETRRWEGFQRTVGSLKSQLTAMSGPAGTRDTWLHIIQPVWSLDPLAVPFNRIHMRWSFACEQVPLSRIPPAATVSPPLLPGHTNRSSSGGMLHSGASQYAWGFAVHAPSELSFPLPKFARAFRGSVGLDHVVGAGGCARAKVYVGSTSGKPAYESPLLIGSKKVVDSGQVGVKTPPDSPGLLILLADPVNRGAPPTADPSNIRDKIDWLDPQIELDIEALRQKVQQHIAPLLADGSQWRLRHERSSAYRWTSSLDGTGTPGARRFRTMIQPKGKPLRIWREMKIGPKDKWLAAHVSLPDGGPAKVNSLALSIGGNKVQARKVPVMQTWQGRPAPLLFPIGDYRGKKVTLELIQAVGGQPLHWKTVGMSETLPPEYELTDIMASVGKSDMKVPISLGQALMATRISRTKKLVALEINQLGGSVGFIPPPGTHRPSYRIPDILLGTDWTGGNKVFVENIETFIKMPGLESMVVTKESKISDAAIAKLKARMPKLTITRTIKRIPSHREGGRADVAWRNLTGRRIVVLYVDPRDGLRFSVFLEPGQVRKVMSNGGSRLEAHYIRKDFTRAEHYASSLPLTTCHSYPGKVWDIKPVGQ